MLAPMGWGYPVSPYWTRAVWLSPTSDYWRDLVSLEVRPEKVDPVDHFVEQLPICHREAAKFPKAIVSCNLGDSPGCRVSQRQLAPCQVHTPQPKISMRAPRWRDPSIFRCETFTRARHSRGELQLRRRPLEARGQAIRGGLRHRTACRSQSGTPFTVGSIWHSEDVTVRGDKACRTAAVCPSLTHLRLGLPARDMVIQKVPSEFA